MRVENACVGLSLGTGATHADPRRFLRGYSPPALKGNTTHARPAWVSRFSAGKPTQAHAGCFGAGSVFPLMAGSRRVLIGVSP